MHASTVRCASRAFRIPRTAAELLLYADKDLFGVNKPPHMTCQSDKTVGERADASPGVAAFMDLQDDIRREFALSEGPFQIHRLDKQTTGLMLLARNERAAKSLSKLFASGKLKKSYLAVVRGVPSEKVGSYTGGLIPAKQGTMQLAPAEQGLKAKIDYELLASHDGLSFLRVIPTHGRKHQIRVLLSCGLGIPILGDVLYDRSRHPHPLVGRSGVPAPLYLHASSITIPRWHPKLFHLRLHAPLPLAFREVLHAINVQPESVLERLEIMGGISDDGRDVTRERVRGLGGKWVGRGDPDIQL